MERRKFSRIPFSSGVEFWIKKSLKKGKIKNLSFGGVYIESKDVPSEGEEVSVFLEVEGFSPPVKLFLKGIVVRSEKKGFALKFNYIAPESFLHLKNIIYYNNPDSEKAEKEIYEFLGEAFPLVRGLKLLSISAIKEELLNLILERAFLYNPDQPFKLSSGKESPYYLDCRKITLFSRSFEMIGELFWEEIRFMDVQGVAGMSIGADPIVCAVLSKASQEGVSLEGFLVRKEPKKHGTQKQIEGNLREGLRVVIVEDVVTTGKSVLKAVEAVEKAGLNIAKVIALIDRQEGGRENIEKHGLEFKAFFTFDEIINAYRKKREGGNGSS